MDGLERLFGDLKAALDVAGTNAMNEIDKLVANDAASKHTYQNRSQKLQDHTVAGVVRGRFSRGNLVGEVLGDMPYGEYLEETKYRTRGAFAYLLPAFERQRQACELILDIELNEAARAALL